MVLCFELPVLVQSDELQPFQTLRTQSQPLIHWNNKCSHKAVFARDPAPVGLCRLCSRGVMLLRGLSQPATVVIPCRRLRHRPAGDASRALETTLLPHFAVIRNSNCQLILLCDLSYAARTAGAAAGLPGPPGFLDDSVQPAMSGELAKLTKQPRLHVGQQSSPAVVTVASLGKTGCHCLSTQSHHRAPPPAGGPPRGAHPLNSC